jgi:hypothetical protein
MDASSVENTRPERIDTIKLSGWLHVQAWTANCGRNLSHHMGPHKVAERLMLAKPVKLKKAKSAAISKKKRGPGVLLRLVADPSTAYERRKIDASTIRAISTHAALTAAMAETKAPRTVADWGSEFDKLSSAAKGAVMMSQPGAYQHLWLIRTWLKMTMEASGISKLRVGQATPEEFQCIFPDSKKHIMTLTGDHPTMFQALDALGYDGPPELLSMYACLFNVKEVRKALRAKPPNWLKDQRFALRQARRAYRSDHGQNPCPAILISSFAST